jgi:DNA end-binding protein Ku
LRDLIEKKRKLKGAKIETEAEDEKPKRGSNVIDLMAALKQSIEKKGAKPAAAKKAPARKAPAKKAAPARKRA